MIFNEFIVTQHLSKNFSGVQALQDVSITINRGEIHCLAGENGSGKSTFINLIGGFYQPDSGQIFINSKTFKHLQPIDAIHEGIQIIYQDFSLFPNLTVAENLALNTLLEHKRRLINWPEVKRIAQNAIAQIGIDIDLETPVSELSVAEKQLTAISRALLHDARMIVMDEPTTALTRVEVDRLFQIIKKLQAGGISILFVSHKLNEMLEISERITVLRNGRVVSEGRTSTFEHQELAYHMTGRKLTAGERALPQGRSGKKSLLRVVNLFKKNTFRPISFDLRAGEIIGITGLLGSGRTGLARALFGINPADAGEIYVDGNQVTILSVPDAMRRGLAYVPEDRLTEGLFLQQTVEKNIVISVLASLLNWCRLINRNKMQILAKKWINDLQIATPSEKTAVQWLSGGNQQKTVLAKWLAANAKILILNGPTAGVDIGAKIDIHKKIRQLAEKGLGILIISDDIPELIQTCNRIFVMHRGELIDEFATGEIDETHLVQRIGELM
jgi:simple sugar transport system ATP-binding protein